MKYFITIALLLCRLFALAQTAVYPNNGTLYDGAMHKVELLMSADSVTALFDPANSWTNHSYPATFVYDNADTVRNIGVRIKGNTSRNAQKQGIKLEIDEFVNQTYQGLKVFNLNGNHNDPSLTRELLSNYVMRKTGNICMRTNWVQLYINGVYYGLRHQVENIDKKFLTSRFGSSAGNLYKCSEIHSLCILIFGLF